MLARVISHSVIYSLGPQLPKLAGLFLLPFITPHLTDMDFGVWGTIMAYSMIFSAARDLGLVVPMLNSFYKNPSRWKWVWRQIYFFLIVYGILFTLLQILTLYLIMPSEVSQTNMVVILLLIGLQSLLLDVPITIGTRFFQVREKPMPVSAIAFVSGFIAVFVQYITVVYFQVGYMSWFYATFLSSLFGSICYVILNHKHRIYPLFTIRMNWLKPRLKISLPLLPHNYSAYLLNASDRVVMNWFNVSTSNIGMYNVAYMWGNYMDLVGGAVGTAVGPLYYKHFISNEKNSLKALRIFNDFLQVSFVLGAFILALWTKELFYVFIKNDQLRESYLLAVIIIMGYCYRPMYWLIVNRLQFSEKTNQLWKISLLGGVINIILNLIFIPIFGYKAAAFTTFIALMYIGFSGFFLKEFKALDKQDYQPVRWFVLIIFCTLLAYISQNLALSYKMILSIISIIPVFYFANRLHKFHL